VSVGAGNDYGHPAEATVDRLRAVSTDGSDLRVDTTTANWTVAVRGTPVAAVAPPPEETPEGPANERQVA
jgi:hypothetical protein